ncbi:uncharacterized protein LOC134267107 [Saccostrea cucullata]|uniref:uncharacterized protein LOC134267107 n=1 Tax=Saccostrea cuccullata TaxID=36930 RepID=UPI002ED065A4
MSTLKELAEYGQSLNLTGVDLQQFIQQQQAHQRELRAAEQEKHKQDKGVSSQGRALDVYALLPQEKVLDYDDSKTALLKRFEKTEDGFRQNFRKSRPDEGETFSQFDVRLGSYLDRKKEGPADIKVSADLSENEKAEVKTLLEDFSDVLSDVPGLTNLGVHHFKLTSDWPIRIKPNPLPFTSKDVVCDEVKKEVEADAIEPSMIPYSSPIVILKKKDGSNRFCFDFRAINKGNWQLPLDDAAKMITAFQMPFGLFQFRVMPFGLINASASFSRLMRKLVDGMQCVDNFIDNVIVYT